MKGKKIPLLLLVVGIVLILIAVVWYIFSKQLGSAALTIEAVPEANVYINDEMVGKTPYTGEFNAGEVNVELLALAFDSPRVPYKTTVKLTPGVETIIRRNLGETNFDSAGEIISFEKNQGHAAVAVVTKPDNAEVTLGGKPVEHAPILFSDVQTGAHNLSVSAQGYETRSFSINTLEGYTLTAIVDLAAAPSSSPSPSPESQSTAAETKKVTVLKTPVGFLRVRSEPSTSADEVAQVKEGDELDVLETDSSTGWYKVKLEGKAVDEGWVSNEYVELK